MTLIALRNSMSSSPCDVDPGMGAVHCFTSLGETVVHIYAVVSVGDA